ncbi:uncharacterized protein LOC115969977 [Quercus lobata]|uniref:uncharacterized protein LOC115969977 n=1 Tax=Quercus lobata TaxID=97700 RepID=UPI001243EF6F|nr:uncharacterized protein LOC115969977 [Quercus lobata]
MSLLSPEMILILSGAIALSLSVGFVIGLLVWHFFGPAAATPRIAQATRSATNLQISPRRNMRTQEQTDQEGHTEASRQTGRLLELNQNIQSSSPQDEGERSDQTILPPPRDHESGTEASRLTEGSHELNQAPPHDHPMPKNDGKKQSIERFYSARDSMNVETNESEKGLQLQQ